MSEACTFGLIGNKKSLTVLGQTELMLIHTTSFFKEQIQK